MSLNLAPPVLRHPVGADWIDSPDVALVRNPADPDEIVATVPNDDGRTVAMAIAAARDALPAWSRLGGPARGEFLFRSAEELRERETAIARDLTREEGKTIAEATGEVRRTAAIVRYFAGRTHDRIGEIYASSVAGTRIQAIREPLGVVAVVTPWNFPIAIPAWKIAPAGGLGRGNSHLANDAACRIERDGGVRRLVGIDADRDHLVPHRAGRTMEHRGGQGAWEPGGHRPRTLWPARPGCWRHLHKSGA